MTLKVHLRDLMEGPVTLTLDHPPEVLDLRDEEDEYTFKENVRGEVTFKKIRKNIIATGWVKTRAHTRCVRCLEDMAVDIETNVLITYSNDPELVEDGVEIDPLAHVINYFEGEIIEPAPQLRELIMLELPFLPVCSEECKGLCPHCGVNVNKEPCKCEPAEDEEQELEPEWKARLRNIEIEK